MGSPGTPPPPLPFCRRAPQLPRQNTLYYADHAHPSPRQLALYDPASTAELVERLSRDTDSGVHWHSLRNERLSAASGIRLLDDPQPFVREAATVDRRLPTRVLSALLHDAGTATSAAANPAIPEAVMHYLLNRAPLTAD